MNGSSSTLVRRTPLLMATAVLWAFIWSGSWYPSWYIAAAIAMVTVSIVAGTGQLHMRGAVRSTVPVLVYFALLLLTAAWAEYPRETLKWLLVDSIEMVVFLLFFLAGRNSDGNEISCAITTLIIPTIALALLEYRFNPFTPRLAGNALALLPLVIAFAAAGAVLSRRRWPYVLAMCLTFAFLLIDRSRSPLAAGVLAAALAVIAFGRSPADRMRKGVAAVAAATAIVVLLALIPSPRLMMITTVVRAVRMLPASALHARLEREIERTPYWLNVRPREQVSMRTWISALSDRLARQSFPRGIGYMNFQMHFEQRYGAKATLHSMYSAWLIEGGLATAIFVAIWIASLIARSWKRARTAPHLQATLIGLAAMSLLGAFHQIHQSPALWLLLGLASAAADRAALPLTSRDRVLHPSPVAR